MTSLILNYKNSNAFDFNDDSWITFYRYEDWNNYMDIYSVTNKVSHDVSNRNGYPDQECFTATER